MFTYRSDVNVCTASNVDICFSSHPVDLLQKPTIGEII